MAELKHLMPMVPTGGDVSTALDFYKQLGFTATYEDVPNMAIIQRDDTHLMLTDFNDRHVAENTAYRVGVSNIQALYAEYQALDLPPFEDGDGSLGKLEAKPWGSTEFAIKDPAGVCITFYE